MIRLLVFALAGARLTRALQHEKIGEPVRNWVDDRLAPPPCELGVEIDVDAERRRQWLSDLATCDHCLGFWLTLGVVVAWQIRPARPIIEALAAAALLSAAVDHYPGFEHGE